MSVSYIPTTGGSTLSLGQATPQMADANKLTGVDPKIASSAAPTKMSEFLNGVDKYIEQPSQQATDSMQIVYDQMSKIQSDLAKNHPQIANSNWDTVLQDGKLKVTGNLSDKDRTWLEQQLNANTTLVGAAKRYSASVVTFYQGTSDHHWIPTLMGQDGRAYDDVADNINGKLPLRSIASWTSGIRRPGETPQGSDTAINNARKYITSARYPIPA
ncbi:hypothetical protein [Silvimonas iriomotensis]|uniref:Uncharacterized protein n=1 Tax=Silvimonas iriomotensis TaxID=449662 RepID=A0ABQ2PCY2_9NEIS|nr:hypothetical protein [Silvimonas iriomotensis]GGP23404.1 hypothetical protein GCM10010970_34040 [Silvimonas iriomotensis]